MKLQIRLLLYRLRAEYCSVCCRHTGPLHPHSTPGGGAWCNPRVPKGKGAFLAPQGREASEPGYEPGQLAQVPSVSSWGCPTAWKRQPVKSLRHMACHSHTTKWCLPWPAVEDRGSRRKPKVTEGCGTFTPVTTERLVFWAQGRRQGADSPRTVVWERAWWRSTLQEGRSSGS